MELARPMIGLRSWNQLARGERVTRGTRAQLYMLLPFQLGACARQQAAAADDDDDEQGNLPRWLYQQATFT